MKGICLLIISLFIVVACYSQSSPALVSFSKGSEPSLLASTGKVDVYVAIEKQSDGSWWTYLKFENTDNATQPCIVKISFRYWVKVGTKVIMKNEDIDYAYSFDAKQIRLISLTPVSIQRPIIRTMTATSN